MTGKTVFPTVADVASRSLAAVEVLEGRGIDYCCGGHRPLHEACASLGVDQEDLLAAIETAERGHPEDQRDWRSASLTDLVEHIRTRHHEYLRRALPALAARLQSVRQAHRDRHGAMLDELAGVFTAMCEELDAHLAKEERVLFPYVSRLEQQGAMARPPFGTVRNPIRVMEDEHDSAGAALSSIRQTTGNFNLPPDACATFRALYEGLAELERDLHLHIHLENNILFPRASALEEQRLS